MKSLHVNYFEKKGGAAISFKRLVEALKENQHEADTLTFEKYITENYKNKKFRRFINLYDHKVKKYLSIQIKKVLGSENIYKDSINYFSSNLHKYILNSEFDIINYHWINDEMISIEELIKIKKPSVWTFVDMWPFIGAEHYTSKYYFKNSNSEKISLLSKWLMNRKKKIFDNNINIVCISEWLKKEALKSKLLYDKKIECIPCTINTKKWNHVEKNICRELLGLEKNKKYILFSAFNGIQDTRKGFDLLVEALRNLNISTKDYSILILGNSDGIDKYKSIFNFNHIALKNNFEGNFLPLKLYYSSADLVVVPSRLEAFGQVALEAGACKTPSIGFDKTGLEDIIDHNLSGYLAENSSSESLGYYINKFLNEDNNIFSENIRNKIENKFSYKTVSLKYKMLYEKIF